MDEDKYVLSFEIISEAGDARSKAMDAFDKLQDYKFDEAKALLEESKKDLIKAHRIQTKLIRDEIAGRSIETHILMIHAQDHFSMATTAIELVERMVKTYRKLYVLEKGKEESNER